MTARPRILVFDSGLGGLTVLAAIRRLRPDAAFVYHADTAGFPYGALGEADVVERVKALFARAMPAYRPDVAVVACNTASTLLLPHLRAAFDTPFVGTVPAIKPAAEATRSGRISVLATPGTVARDYTRALVDTYAYHCEVTLVGAQRLAAMAESVLRGGTVADADLRREIAPAFVGRGRRRTDTIVLACTHYPLIADRLERVAPWPVRWIDPAPAIAERTVSFVADRPSGPLAAGAGAVFTGPADEALRDVLRRYGIARLEGGAAV